MATMDPKYKLLAKYNKEPKRKLIGKRYLVTTDSAYFHNYYTGCEDLEIGGYVQAWGPGLFNDDEGKKFSWKKGAEALYLWLNTPDKCRKFLKGQVTKVRKNQLGDSFGQNKLFYSY